MVMLRMSDLSTEGLDAPALDPTRVLFYRRTVDTNPPVVVFDTPEGLLLADGHHRLAAAIDEGRETIEAEIRVGLRHDALEYAVVTAARQRGVSPEEIRAHLDGRFPRPEANERVLAEGVAYADASGSVDPEDLRQLVSGPGWPIVVTDRRILWANDGEVRWTLELPFAAIRSMTEVTFAHRYALLLDHDVLEQTVWVPARRFLWWSWGDATAVRPNRRTLLAFSHRDTDAAAAIRTRLEVANVRAAPPVLLPSVEPVERERGWAELTATRPSPGRRWRARYSPWRTSKRRTPGTG